MEQIRSFIAIELSGELKLELTRLQDRLKSGSHVPAKWVDSSSIHLTLKFLGNIDRSMADKITVALGEVVRGIHPFRLALGRPGVFPNERRVQVVWVGLTGDIERLGQLQQRIESSLVTLGFAKETRPFTPHLTLARIRDRATPNERQRLGQLVVRTDISTGSSLEVDSVHLMKSQLTSEGAIYSRISSINLK
jgi:2'-5' RNA ligase